MSSLVSIPMPAPVGFDSVHSPELLPPERAGVLQNWLTDRAGKLRGQISLANIFASAQTLSVDAVGFYYGATAAGDRLLFASGGVLYACTLPNPPTFTPTVTNTVALGGGFTPGVRLRFAQYKAELIILQADGAIQPKRYDGTGLYQLGISPPSAPLVTIGAAGVKTGTVGYKQTYYDNHGRESSPSPATSITLTADQAQVTITPSTDAQVHGSFIYATAAAGSVYYRIANVPIGTTLYTDNSTDASVQTGTVAPNAGQFDIPDKASVVAIHKNRIFMNDAADPSSIQVNNVDSPTQWASISVVATDGVRLTVAMDQGDVITGLVPYGSLLAIFKQRGTYLLFGDTIDDWVIRAIHEKGCTTPDTCVRCDNVLLLLANDGVYATSYDGSFLLQLVGGDWEDQLQVLQSSTAGEALLSNAFAFYVNRRYHLVIGSTIYVYDFTNKGWTTYALASGFAGATTVTEGKQVPIAYLARSDTNQVAALNTYTASAMTDMRIKTRPFFASPQMRSTIFRAKRFFIYGTGVLDEGGTFTITCDGVRTETYTIPAGSAYNPTEGVLIYQEVSPMMRGTMIELDIVLNGTGVEITNIVGEFTKVG